VEQEGCIPVLDLVVSSLHVHIGYLHGLPENKGKIILQNKRPNKKRSYSG